VVFPLSLHAHTHTRALTHTHTHTDTLTHTHPHTAMGQRPLHDPVPQQQAQRLGGRFSGLLHIYTHARTHTHTHTHAHTHTHTHTHLHTHTQRWDNGPFTTQYLNNKLSVLGGGAVVFWATVSWLWLCSFLLALHRTLQRLSQLPYMQVNTFNRAHTHTQHAHKCVKSRTFMTCAVSFYLTRAEAHASAPQPAALFEGK